MCWPVTCSRRPRPGPARPGRRLTARGSRASSRLPTSHLGQRTQADNCIVHFYNRLGDIARRIAAGAANSTDVVRGYAAVFESAGCDELTFIRATASPGHLELLAGPVL